MALIYKNKLEGSNTNDAYLVKLRTTNIQSKDSSGYISIETFLPESLSLNLSSNYEQLLKSYISSLDEAPLEMATGLISKAPIIGGALSSAVKAATELNAQKTLLDNFSAYPTWVSNSVIEFTIPFNFNAVDDTQTDVMDPVLSLMKLTCPQTEKNGFQLIAPGPRIKIINGNIELDTSKILELRIGKYCVINGVIVTRVDTTFDSRFDKDGLPISAQVSVQLQTLLPPTISDIQNWFTPKSSYNQLDRLSMTNVAQSVKTRINQIQEEAKNVSVSTINAVAGKGNIASSTLEKADSYINDYKGQFLSWLSK